MFPMPVRIPRRWKVLFWKLADRLRTPRAEPVPMPGRNGDRLDEPAYLRRSTRH